MARDVHVLQGTVVDLRSALHQVVDGARDAALVTGDRVGGYNDGVAGAGLDSTVGAVGDPAQSCERLPLRAGHKYGDVRVGDLVDIPLLDEHRGREIQVAELTRDLDVAYHGASGHAHEPVVPLRRLDHLADAMDVGGEGRDDDPAPRLVEDVLEGRLYGLLGGHVARSLGVGRVAKVGEYPLLAKLGQPTQVYRLALDGRQVDLKVARKQDQAGVGTDCYGHGVGDRVVDVDKLEAIATQVLPVASLYLAQVALLDPELLQLAAYEPERELGCVDRNIELAQQIRQRPHMVLMTVRENYALQLVRVLPQVCEVRKNKIDARHLLVRERHTGVHQYYSARLAHGRHVLADLTQPSEGHDLQGLFV